LPLLLKIAPDLDDAALHAIVDTALAVGIEGMIVTNTTIARTGLSDARRAGEAGGLSGRPLFQPSTTMLAKVRRHAGKGLVLVGAGGVDSAETAFAKIAAGADLVELYTGFIYRGPGLAREIHAGLVAILEARGLSGIGEAVGSETDRWLAG
jgi:dihydroorotate dehydrogenase